MSPSTIFTPVFTALLILTVDSTSDITGSNWRSLAEDGPSDSICVRAQHRKQLQYTWMADENTRQMAQVNPGNKARLRAAMQVIPHATI